MPRRTTIAVVAVVVAAAAVALVALAGGGGRGLAPEAGTGQVREARPGVAVVPEGRRQPLPAFSGATLDGTRIDLASLRGRPLVLNFWATWCPPCIREMPVLDRFARDYATQGWRVLGIAADNAAPVRQFLTHSPVGYATALAGFAGLDLSRQLGNLSGALPFSVVLDRRGRIAQRHMGELRYAQLVDWAAAFS
jgi:thiol-disulfide isomerase/thioredoxin